MLYNVWWNRTGLGRSKRALADFINGHFKPLIKFAPHNLNTYIHKQLFPLLPMVCGESSRTCPKSLGGAVQVRLFCKLDVATVSFLNIQSFTSTHESFFKLTSRTSYSKTERRASVGFERKKRSVTARARSFAEMASSRANATHAYR